MPSLYSKPHSLPISISVAPNSSVTISLRSGETEVLSSPGVFIRPPGTRILSVSPHSPAPSPDSLPAESDPQLNLTLDEDD